MTLDELAALEKAATPGPWRLMPDGDGGFFSILLGPTSTHPFGEMDVGTDANLIAASRNMLPKLIAVARAAKTCLLYNSIDYDGGLEDALRALEGEA